MLLYTSSIIIYRITIAYNKNDYICYAGKIFVNKCQNNVTIFRMYNKIIEDKVSHINCVGNVFTYIYI